MTSELSAFLDAFERGTLPKSEWTHAAHLKMACLYLAQLPADQARDRIRHGIRHYNECQGVANSTTGGYHETLTVFWCRMVGRFLETTPPGEALHVTISRLLETFAGNQGMYKEYWTFDVVKSSEARAVWMEPDRKPI